MFLTRDKKQSHRLPQAVHLSNSRLFPNGSFTVSVPLPMFRLDCTTNVVIELMFFLHIRLARRTTNAVGEQKTCDNTEAHITSGEKRHDGLLLKNEALLLTIIDNNPSVPDLPNRTCAKRYRMPFVL